MRKMVKVELTQAQAWALIYAAGDIIDHEDVLESSFHHGSSRKAAVTGLEKLTAAWRATDPLNRTKA